MIAYYTRRIAKYVERHSPLWHANPPSPGKVPKPFFHETVGASAWGLAIHGQSRLIAVSTNMHEINVFAFALNPPFNGQVPDATTKFRISKNEKAPLSWAGLNPAELEGHLRARDRDWRILLPLTADGSNMPSISFADDKKGNAEKVVAVDIIGYCWVLDIWKVGSRPIRIAPPLENL